MLHGGSATGVVDITPHATNFIAKNGAGEFPRAFYVTADGTVAFECWDGSTGSISAVAGQIYPICIRAVRVSGTSATGIKGLY